MKLLVNSQSVRHTWNNFGTIGAICVCFIVTEECGYEHLGFIKGRVFLDKQRDFSAPQGGLWSVELNFWYVCTNYCYLIIFSVVQHWETDESCEPRELSEDRQSVEQEDILDLADEGGDGEYVL